MALVAEKKKTIIESNRLDAKDTGSTEVQVALLTERIKELTEHLQNHTKDFHGKRGLLMLVSKRRRLLKYLSESNSRSYRNLIDKLGLRR